MARWEPECYLEFAAPRLRPALDLLAAVPLARAARVHDLGCGTGNMAQHLRARWPEAAVAGVDSSAEMLVVARAAHPDMAWAQADLATWAPEAPADLLYSNAALQWLGDHAALLPRLLRCLAPGGVLALQMPRNFAAPSHTLIHAVAAEGPWAGRLEGVGLHDPVAAPEAYYEYLAPSRAASISGRRCTSTPSRARIRWSNGAGARRSAPSWPRSGPRRNAPPSSPNTRAASAPPIPRVPTARTLYPFRRLFIVAQVA